MKSKVIILFVLCMAVPVLASPSLSIDLEAIPTGGTGYDINIYATIHNAVGGIRVLSVDIYSPDTINVAVPNIAEDGIVPTVWSSRVSSGGFLAVPAYRKDVSDPPDPDTAKDDARGCTIQPPMPPGAITDFYLGTNSSLEPVKTLVATEKWVVNGTANLYAFVKLSSGQSSAEYFDVANGNTAIKFGSSDVVVGNVIVPEPMTLVMLGLGGLGLLRKRT